jgi:hypothetical protein
MFAFKNDTPSIFFFVVFDFLITFDHSFIFCLNM